MFNGFAHHDLIVGEINLDGDLSRPIATVQGTVEITQVDIMNAASGASHGTNFSTYNLINGGTDGTGTTVIATATTAATAVSAFAPFNLTITDANKTVTDGQVLIFERDEENTDAVALANATVQVRYVQTKAP